MLDAGRRYAFRYLADGGRWFNDDAAHDYQSNRLRWERLRRGPHGILSVEATSPRRPATDVHAVRWRAPSSRTADGT